MTFLLVSKNYIELCHYLVPVSLLHAAFSFSFRLGWEGVFIFYEFVLVYFKIFFGVNVICIIMEGGGGECGV